MTETNRYENGKIYKIVSNHTDKIYIGSTCKERLCQRLAKHKANYTEWLKYKKNYTSSFELFELGDVEIILIENFNCKTKDELFKKEKEYIEKYKDIIVNKKRPVITKIEKNETAKKYDMEHKEYKKQYRKIYNENNKEKIKQSTRIYNENHKEELKQYQKIYNENNKEKIKQNLRKYKELYDCKCGRQITKASKYLHNKSKFHLEHI
tara:strand:- start:3566 stop:4189 length:624 start_codon:yes stop_codon:yes gene_type:complete